MRITFLLWLFVFFGLPQVVSSQVDHSLDVEYTEVCMVDSLISGEIFRFQRLIHLPTLDVIDLDPATGNTYTVAGTLLTCDAYDLAQSLADPLAELYPDCQCAYTISQENHSVIEIRGDTFQDFTVQFEEVVKRRCGEQTMGSEIYRDTLTQTGTLDNMTMSFGWSFTAPGQIVNSVNLRLYRTSGVPNQVSIVLDPDLISTVYPGLSIDTADLRYDGTNTAAMAAAFLAVVQFAVEQVDGPTVNAITTSNNANSVFLRTELLHQPNYPYVTQPRSGDPDYFQSSTIPGGTVALAVSGKSLNTSTSFYSEQCEPIRTLENGSYIFYDPETPLDLQPRLDVETTIFSASSTPTAFCDADPAFCAEFAPGNVSIVGCIELCSDPEYQPICLTDSLANGSLIRFYRLYNWADSSFIDYTETFDTTYTPTGLIISCRQADNIEIDTFQVEVVSSDCPVQDIPEIEDVTSVSAFPGDFYHSISITVATGTVDLTIGSGTQITLPQGYTGSWHASSDCSFLTQTFTLNPASGGRAIVNTLR